jgi:hypothetical protein
MTSSSSSESSSLSTDPALFFDVVAVVVCSTADFLSVLKMFKKSEEKKA